MDTVRYAYHSWVVGWLADGLVSDDDSYEPLSSGDGPSPRDSRQSAEGDRQYRRKR